VDASSYGRLVERGGYATGGTVRTTGLTLVGESGPELTFLAAGCTVLDPAEALLRQLFASRSDPDDGSAGVPAKV